MERVHPGKVVGEDMEQRDWGYIIIVMRRSLRFILFFMEKPFKSVLEGAWRDPCRFPRLLQLPKAVIERRELSQEV